MERGLMTPEQLYAALLNAPKKFWDFQKGLGSDPGLPKEMSSAKLLDCICDGADGHVVEGDRNKTAECILRYRQNMAQFSRELCCGDDVVFEALRSVSDFNKTVDGLSEESAAFNVSCQPDYYWKVIEERRKKIPGPRPWGPTQVFRATCLYCRHCAILSPLGALAILRPHGASAILREDELRAMS